MFRRKKSADVLRDHEPVQYRDVQVINPRPGRREVRSASGRDNAAPVVAADVKSYAVLESVDGEGLVLIGRNTFIVGEITNCTRVEIQGGVDGTLIADAVVVREGGVVKGRLQTTNAEVHGDVDGEVVVRSLLDVRHTGQVTGDVSYGKLSVAVGGHLSGRLKTQQAAESAEAAESEPAEPPMSEPEPQRSGRLNGRAGH